MQKNQDFEKRNYIRLDFQLQLNFNKEDGSGESFPAITKNISAEGLRFTSDQKLEKGSKIDFEIDLPNREKPVHFKGEVVWSKAASSADKGKKGNYDIGIKFVEVDKKDRNALMLYICEKMIDTLSSYLKLN